LALPETMIWHFVKQTICSLNEKMFSKPFYDPIWPLSWSLNTQLIIAIKVRTVVEFQGQRFKLCIICSFKIFNNLCNHWTIKYEPIFKLWIYFQIFVKLGKHFKDCIFFSKLCTRFKFIITLWNNFRCPFLWFYLIKKPYNWYNCQFILSEQTNCL
jgi:hypothetical protein